MKSHIVAHEVFIGLPFDDDPGFSAANNDDRRTRVAVVIRCHGVVVRAGGEHRQNIADLGLLNERVLLNEVAAFAALSGNGRRKVCGLVRLICDEASVIRLIERCLLYTSDAADEL